MIAFIFSVLFIEGGYGKDYDFVAHVPTKVSLSGFAFHPKQIGESTPGVYSFVQSKTFYFNANSTLNGCTDFYENNPKDGIIPYSGIHTGNINNYSTYGHVLSWMGNYSRNWVFGQANSDYGYNVFANGSLFDTLPEKVGGAGILTYGVSQIIVAVSVKGKIYYKLFTELGKKGPDTWMSGGQVDWSQVSKLSGPVEIAVKDANWFFSPDGRKVTAVVKVLVEGEKKVKTSAASPDLTVLPIEMTSLVFIEGISKLDPESDQPLNYTFTVKDQRDSIPRFTINDHESKTERTLSEGYVPGGFKEKELIIASDYNDKNELVLAKMKLSWDSEKYYKIWQSDNSQLFHHVVEDKKNEFKAELVIDSTKIPLWNHKYINKEEYYKDDDVVTTQLSSSKLSGIINLISFLDLRNMKMQKTKSVYDYIQISDLAKNVRNGSWMDKISYDFHDLKTGKVINIFTQPKRQKSGENITVNLGGLSQFQYPKPENSFNPAEFDGVLINDPSSIAQAQFKRTGSYFDLDMDLIFKKIDPNFFHSIAVAGVGDDFLTSNTLFNLAPYAVGLEDRWLMPWNLSFHSDLDSIKFYRNYFSLGIERICGVKADSDIGMVSAF